MDAATLNTHLEKHLRAHTFPVEGLEKTHAGGIRYPIPVFLRFQAEFPKSYQDLETFWSQKQGRS